MQWRQGAIQVIRRLLVLLVQIEVGRFVPVVGRAAICMLLVQGGSAEVGQVVLLVAPFALSLQLGLLNEIVDINLVQVPRVGRIDLVILQDGFGSRMLVSSVEGRRVLSSLLSELGRPVPAHVTDLAGAVGLILLRQIVLRHLRLMLIRLVEVHRVYDAWVGKRSPQILPESQQGYHDEGNEEANVCFVGYQLVAIQINQRSQESELHYKVEDLWQSLVPEVEVVEFETNAASASLSLELTIRRLDHG